MAKKNLAFLFLLVIIIAFFVSSLAYAQGIQDSDRPDIRITPPAAGDAPVKEEDIYGAVGRIARIIATIFWIASAISAFYAGFLYFGAGGNPETLKKAHKQIWWTVIAIVIGLMAWGLPVLIKNIISNGGAPRSTSPPFPPPPPGIPT